MKIGPTLKQSEIWCNFISIVIEHFLLNSTYSFESSKVLKQNLHHGEILASRRDSTGINHLKVSFTGLSFWNFVYLLSFMYNHLDVSV